MPLKLRPFSSSFFFFFWGRFFCFVFYLRKLYDVGVFGLRKAGPGVDSLKKQQQFRLYFLKKRNQLDVSCGMHARALCFHHHFLVANFIHAFKPHSIGRCRSRLRQMPLGGRIHLAVLGVSCTSPKNGYWSDPPP